MKKKNHPNLKPPLYGVQKRRNGRLKLARSHHKSRTYRENIVQYACQQTPLDSWEGSFDRVNYKEE